MNPICNFCNNTSEHCCPEADKNQPAEQAFKELEQKLEREQAKKEREFQEKVFADCEKWDNRELGADEAYAKNADMRLGAFVVGGE